MLCLLGFSYFFFFFFSFIFPLHLFFLHSGISVWWLPHLKLLHIHLREFTNKNLVFPEPKTWEENSKSQFPRGHSSKPLLKFHFEEAVTCPWCSVHALMIWNIWPKCLVIHGSSIQPLNIIFFNMTLKLCIIWDQISFHNWCNCFVKPFSFWLLKEYFNLSNYLTMYLVLNPYILQIPQKFTKYFKHLKLHIHCVRYVGCF